MSNPILGPMGVANRYKTHRSQIMTLWVTRQGQNFVTSGDLQLCDAELIQAHVELVGEPGIGNFGVVAGPSATHKGTINKLHGVNDAGVTSTVYGVTGENRVLEKTHIHHGHANVSITGMTQGHQFRSDVSQGGNQSSIMIPTDMGLGQLHHDAWPSTPLMLENVHLQQNLQIHTTFAGSWPELQRVARFAEDWADTAGGTKRNTDGTIRYFVNDDEGQSSVQECQVPSNCINVMKLVFRIHPRSEL